MSVQNKNIYKKNKARKRKKTSYKRFFLWTVLVVFLGSIFFISRIPSLQLKGIQNIEGNSTVSDDEIHIFFNQYEKKRFFFPLTNKIIFSRQKFSQEIQNTFPRLEVVSVLKQKDSVSLVVSERTASYLWCGEVLFDVTEDIACWFVDARGFIFDKAPFFTGSSFLRLYGGIDTHTDIVGQYFDSSILNYYSSFVDILNDFGIFVRAVFVLEDGQVRIVLDSVHGLSKSPFIAVHTSNSIMETIDILKTAFMDETVLKDVTSQYEQLEYIDLRFENQFIYKFKDENTFNKPLDGFSEQFEGDLEANIQEVYEEHNENTEESVSEETSEHSPEE